MQIIGETGNEASAVAVYWISDAIVWGFFCVTYWSSDKFMMGVLHE